MREDEERLRVTVPAPLPEDDAAGVYSQIVDRRAADDLDAWFDDLVGEEPEEQGGQEPAPAGGEASPAPAGAPAAPAAGEGAPASPAAPAAAGGGVPGDGGDGWKIEDVAGAVLAVGKDLAGGLVEAPRQGVGGVLSALDEAAQFMEEVVPLGNVQLVDPETGEFDLEWLSSEEAEGDALFNAIIPGEAETVTGGLVRSTTQFLSGFIPALRVMRGARALGAAGSVARVPLLSEVSAGAIADAVVFDPHEDRLSTFLNEVPAIEAIVPDYLADNNPANESSWEGRIKNAVEGAGLGLAADLLFRSFKYYKAQRQANAQAGLAANPIGAQAQAARDELKAAAREELVNDVPDEALAPLGDPDGPLLIEAAPDETLAQATSRLKEATARAEATAVNNDALGRINAVREKFTARAQAAGRDPMDEMLDELRSGAVSSAKLPKRPVSAIVRSLGGIDPTSSFAGDLRSRGITAKSFPGLFRKGGNQTLDNVPISEHPIFAERGADDGAGYIDQQSFIDGLEAELKGEPWRTAEEQAAFDDLIGPIDELDEQLSRLGIDYENMSNEAVKARLKQIEDEEAIFARELAPVSEDAGGFEGYLDRVNPGRKRVEEGERPNLGMGDMFGMAPKGAREVGSPLDLDDLGTVRFVQGKNGDVYALGVNPDLGEEDVFGYAMRRGDGVELHVVAEAQGRGIGSELQYHFRKADPNAPSGGLTEGGERTLRRTFERLRAEGVVEDAGGDVKAPAAPFDAGPLPVAPGGKVYINHARINSADDVKAVLQQMADMDQEAIDLKRRGVVSNEQTIRESSQEYRDINDLLGRAPGPMTAAQAVAARRLLVSSGEQIVQLAKKASAPDASKADIFNFRRAMAVHYALQSEVVAARTETARALQSWAIPAGATKARTQAITDLISMHGGAGDLQSLAKAVTTVADNPTGLNTMARELGRGRFGKALYQVWINGLLSSPKTHAVNVLSNSMVALYSIPERYLSAHVSKAFYDGEVSTAEIAGQAYGLVKGIRDGVRLVAQGNKAEGSADLSDIFDAFVKTENMHGNAISADAFGLKPEGGLGWGIDMLGKIVNVPGDALAAEDKFFKSVNYRMELNALAYRQASSEGLEGKEFAARVVDILNNPPESLKAEALDLSHYNTFTAPLGKIGQSVQMVLGRVPFARVVVPFVRTPTNIMKYTFARTPLAYLSGKIRADIAAGGSRAAQAHARVALGSMIMLTVADMTAEGTIEGRGPLDPEQRRVWLNSGHMPYSVKVGDRRYAFNRLDPIGMMMGLSADMAEIFANANEEDAGMLATAGVVALASNLANKTYMSGIFDAIAAFDTSNPTSNPAKYLENFAGSLVPYSSFLRNSAVAADPILRESRTAVYGDDGKPDPVATWLDGVANRMRKGIPGLSDELPPRRDLWGEDINTASGLGWAYDFVSPIASKVDDPDPVEEVILANQIRVSSAPRIINGVRLSGEEYADFVREAGRPAKEYLDRLVKSPGFKRMSDGPDGMKAEIVLDVINNFRDRARAVMMQRYPKLRERSFLRDQERAKMFTGQGG